MQTKGERITARRKDTAKDLRNNPKIVEQYKRLFIASLKFSADKNEICRKIGLSPAKVEQWRREDPMFAQHWKEALDDYAYIAEDAVYQKMLSERDGADKGLGVETCKWYLEKRDSRYSQKQHVSVEIGAVQKLIDGDEMQERLSKAASVETMLLSGNGSEEDGGNEQELSTGDIEGA